MHHSLIRRICAFAVCTAAALPGSLLAADEAPTWWNETWTQRQKINFDASELDGSVDGATILVRLSDGNFQFQQAREDGSDIRFVSADGGKLLPHHIESYDNVLNEAYAWVRLPQVNGGAKEQFYIYYGNQDAAMPAANAPVEAYSDEFAAVFHFSERGGVPTDATSNANKSDTPGATADAALIGSGLRLMGTAPVSILNSDTLAWSGGGDLSVSLWTKPTVLQANAVVLSRTGAEGSLRLLLDQGVPVIETTGAQTLRSEAGAPVVAGAWTHLAFVATGGNIQLFVNGEPYSTLAASLPAADTPLVLGDILPKTAGREGYIGELDELRISNTARDAAWVGLQFLNQGTSDSAGRMVALDAIEGGQAGGHSEMLEHVMLFGDIAKNMMFDGWIAVGVCIIMIIIGWTVAIRKFVYLNKIEKGNKEFMKLWKSTSTDLTALDHADTESIRSMGGSIDEEDQELMRDSPLYQIYHIGSEEISHRLEKMSERHKMEGLPGRSIQAIRASLDAGLVHENHRLTDGLVYLTISVAGGPYVGLLGTVVGVMITFALIAKTGEVNVNAIAPGIASALLATVAGLVVAIPALFIYSYLNSRIKNTVSMMHVFIDEFVAKMAEFYRPQSDTEGAEKSD